MKLNLNNKRKLTRTINGQSFSVVPYIDTTKKQFILTKVLEYYEEMTGEDFQYVVCTLRAEIDTLIIKIVTDIEFDEDTSYDKLLSSGLINVVRDSVINYDEIYQDALFVIQTTKIASLFPDIDGVFDKVASTLNNMSPEQKENFEVITRASLANSASNSILKNLMGDS